MIIDDMLGQDPPDTDLSPKMQGYLAHLAEHHPDKFAGVVNGLAFSDRGLAATVRSGLAPFMKLPPEEPRTLTRARMAAFIAERVAATGQVTHDELLGGGFTAHQIDTLFDEAKRIAGVDRMAA